MKAKTKAEKALAQLTKILWPKHNPDQPWDPDTIEAVAQIVSTYNARLCRKGVLK